MLDHSIRKYLETVEGRYVDGVGFANRPGGKGRPDASCWAILALEAAGTRSDVVGRARQALAKAQCSDGRICISPQHVDACWPTPLAILAWHGSPEYEGPRNKAVQFLLQFEQVRTVSSGQTPLGHNGTIRGWPWIAETHAWVEPTAYALMALRVCRYTSHSRTRDAVRLLLDRQLPGGGWNYGNTTVFGQELRPMPETTGPALEALAGMTPRDVVEKSIVYLRSRREHLDTPMSLAWAILGLHAWQERPEQAQEQILRVLAAQDQYGPCDTISLSLLLLAWQCQTGLVRSLEHTGSQDDK